MSLKLPQIRTVAASFSAFLVRDVGQGKVEITVPIGVWQNLAHANRFANLLLAKLEHVNDDADKVARSFCTIRDYWQSVANCVMNELATQNALKIGCDGRWFLAGYENEVATPLDAPRLTKPAFKN